jgi:hypothetical protein
MKNAMFLEVLFIFYCLKKECLMNHEYLQELISILYGIEEIEEVDRMFSERFGRPISAWRIFRFLLKIAVEKGEKEYCFNPDAEFVEYSKEDSDSFEDFVTIMLHESTHGVCYFISIGSEKNLAMFYEKDEEAFCWKISQAVCNAIGVSYNKVLADKFYAFHLAVSKGSLEEIEKVNDSLPESCRVF